MCQNEHCSNILLIGKKGGNASILKRAHKTVQELLAIKDINVKKKKKTFRGNN